jgi:hypothetical protein
MRWLRTQAQSLGRVPDVSFGSLKLVEECLIGLGFAEDHAKTVVAALRQAHELRSKVKGHASGSDADAIRRKILKEFGTYKSHLWELCQKCDESIRMIAEAFKKVTQDKTPVA